MILFSFFLSFKRYSLSSCYQPVIQRGGPACPRRTQRKGGRQALNTCPRGSAWACTQPRGPWLPRELSRCERKLGRECPGQPCIRRAAPNCSQGGQWGRGCAGGGSSHSSSPVSLSSCHGPDALLPTSCESSRRLCKAGAVTALRYTFGERTEKWPAG